MARGTVRMIRVTSAVAGEIRREARSAYSLLRDEDQSESDAEFSAYENTYDKYVDDKGYDSSDVTRALTQFRSRAADADITNRFPDTEETPMPRRTVRDEPQDAESAGAQYAQAQLEGDYFMDWVREQLAEAADMQDRGEEMLPLENKQDALVVAKNMLQQLEWDTKKGLDERELGRLAGVESVSRETHNEFYKGFREALDSSRDWLADELLRLKGEMRGGGTVEARRSPKKPVGGIEDDTSIMPHIVADSVISEVELYTGIEVPDKRVLADHLADRADDVYKNDERFRGQIRAKGNRGRDQLYVFMRHWLSSELKKHHPEIFQKLPASFANGEPLPRGGARETRRSTTPTIRARNPEPVDDPEYVIQGAWSDGRITESFGFDDEDTARSEAWKLSKSPYFEGDYVRIITRDGELVWDSRGNSKGKGAQVDAKRGKDRPYQVAFTTANGAIDGWVWATSERQAKRRLEDELGGAAFNITSIEIDQPVKLLALATTSTHAGASSSSESYPTCGASATTPPSTPATA